MPQSLVTSVQRFIAFGGGAHPRRWKDHDELRALALYLAARFETSMTDSAKRAEAIEVNVAASLLSNHRSGFAG